MKTIVIFLTLIIFSGITGLNSAFAQEEQPVITAPAITAAEDTETPSNDPMSLLTLVKLGGVVGVIIIILSCIALALIIDYAISIRGTRLAPPRDIMVLKKLISERKFDEMLKLDSGKTSFLTQVVLAGLKETSQGYNTMIKTMEDTIEALNAAISRKIEHLNVIGNIAPMLGLLGTVIGMLRCFNEISQITGAVEPQQLAGGIFEALITTCMGLIVAIPTIYFYALFRNRLDELTAQTALKAEELVHAFKHQVNGDSV
jgi:biopolymer transport protein ExbB